MVPAASCRRQPTAQETQPWVGVVQVGLGPVGSKEPQGVQGPSPGPARATHPGIPSLWAQGQGPQTSPGPSAERRGRVGGLPRQA